MNCGCISDYTPVVDIDHRLDPFMTLVEEEGHGIFVLSVKILLVGHGCMAVLAVVMSLHEKHIFDKGYGEYEMAVAAVYGQGCCLFVVAHEAPHGKLGHYGAYA